MCDTCLDQKIIIGKDGRPKRCPSCSVIPAQAGIQTAPALTKAAPRSTSPRTQR